MTPEDAALVLSCWLCGGPLRAMGRPWRFRCMPCGLTIRGDDIGALQQAIMRRATVAAGSEHRG